MHTDRIGRPEARRLAGDEFQRFAELTGALTPDEWAMPTDCTAWDVRRIGLHVLGSAEAQASVGEFAHQLRRGLPLNKQIGSHHWVDGMNEQQIRDRVHLSTASRSSSCCSARPAGPSARANTATPPHHHTTTPGGIIMATGILQKWDGLTPDHYDARRGIVGGDRDVPAGMRFHVASFGEGVLRMTDVWDSEELFGAFVQTRILPGLR